MPSKDTGKTIDELVKKNAALEKSIGALIKSSKAADKSFEKLTDSIEDAAEAEKEQTDHLKKLAGQLNTLKDKIVNVNDEYESFASKLVRPLNLGAIGGTLGVVSAVHAAHALNIELSGLADGFRVMSDASGNMGGAMTTMFQSMGESLGGKGQIQSAMSALHNTGLEVNQTFQKLTTHVADLDQITGVTTDTWAGFHGEVVRGFGAGIEDIKELSSAFIGTGLQGTDLTKVIDTVKTTIDQVGSVAKDGVKSIKALTISMGSATSVITKLGVSAQKASEFIGSMMNPEDFAKNSTMLANLGVSYEDYVASLDHAEGKTKLLNKAMENLPQLAERISEIRDPFQRMNLAKSLGVPMEIVSKMAGKTKAEIRDLMAIQMKESSEKEALEKKRSEAKANVEKFQDSLWLITMKMLGPVMAFVSNNYGNFFKVLSENSASVADAFSSLFGVIQKLIPLLVKVSIFIGKTIAKAFEIVVKPVGKLVDVILNALFPILDNFVIPAVEKLAKGLDWLADHISAVIPLLVPFAVGLGGLLILKKLTGFVNDTVTAAKMGAANMKDAFMKARQGDFKGALGLINKKKDEAAQKTVLSNSDDISKPIVSGLRRVENAIKNPKPNKSLQEGFKANDHSRMQKAAELRQQRALKQNTWMQKAADIKQLHAAKLDMHSKRSAASKIGGVAESGVLGALDFSSVGKEIGAAAAGPGMFSQVGNVMKKGIGKAFAPAMGALKPLGTVASKASVGLRAIGGPIAFGAGALIGAVDGVVSAEKYFGKELTSAQDEKLQELKKRKDEGEQLSESELKEMKRLTDIKAKMMTEDDKNQLKSLQEKKRLSVLTAQEQKKLDELLKKQTESTATLGERIAGGMAGALSFGILPLIDSFFGTELTAQFANFLKPLGDSIANFFKMFNPIVDALGKIWDELLVQFRWAWARISAFIEVNIVNPLKELWESFKGIFVSLAGVFGDLFGGISFGEDTMKGFADQLYNAWKWIKTKIFPAFKLIMIPLDIIIGGLKGIVLGFKNFFDGISAAIDKIKNGDILGGIWEALKGVGALIMQPLTVMFQKAKLIFTRIGQVFKRTWDSIMLKILDNPIVKSLKMFDFDGEKYVNELKQKEEKWKKTDEWTNQFDNMADSFFAAQTKAEKAGILNKVMGSYNNLMSANSALDEETKTTYRNMLEMMRKQLMEMKDAKKEAKQTGGAITAALKKEEPKPAPKPEIKLRAISLTRLI